jgi:hypothetical protein
MNNSMLAQSCAKLFRVPGSTVTASGHCQDTVYKMVRQANKTKRILTDIAVVAEHPAPTIVESVNHTADQSLPRSAPVVG